MLFFKKISAVRILFFIGVLFLFGISNIEKARSINTSEEVGKCDLMFDDCKKDNEDSITNKVCDDAYSACIQTVAQAKPNLEQAGEKLNKIAPAYGSNPKTLTEVVGSIIQIALTLLGVVFLILMVYGGYKWMMARGDAKEVETAKDIISRALIGLLVVMAAYAIAYFVIARLTTEAGIVTSPSNQSS